MIKMLIDCDTGIDDSIAILLALKRPDVRVMGMISGFGNTDAVQAARNCIGLIELAKPGYDVPVAIGANAPLVGAWSGPVPHIHGRNGVGEAVLPQSSQKPIDEAGAAFLVRMARENPGELTLVTLGRMTNLAHALALEPQLPKLLKNVVSMGGAVKCSGNASPTAEANIAGDPEAADAVMTAGFDLTMVGLDVTMKTRLALRHLQALDKYCAAENRPINDYIQAALKFYYRFNRVQNNCMDDCPVHDPLAVLVAIDPSLVTLRKMRAHVECGGTYCRGMIVTDVREEPFDAPFTTFCMDVEGEKAVAELLTTFMDQTYAYPVD